MERQLAQAQIRNQSLERPPADYSPRQDYQPYADVSPRGVGPPQQDFGARELPPPPQDYSPRGIPTQQDYSPRGAYNEPQSYRQEPQQVCLTLSSIRNLYIII